MDPSLAGSMRSHQARPSPYWPVVSSRVSGVGVAPGGGQGWRGDTGHPCSFQNHQLVQFSAQTTAYRMLARNQPLPPDIADICMRSGAPNVPSFTSQLKIKCKNFLVTLLRLSSEQSKSVARNVRALVQCLVDGQLEPEVFTTRLVNALNCSPQPMMIPFLKTSLPHLQSSLAARELTIEGLQPPTANQAQTKARNPPIAHYQTSRLSQTKVPIRSLHHQHVQHRHLTILIPMHQVTALILPQSKLIPQANT